jgi:predicted nucleotidyltransferase
MLSGSQSLSKKDQQDIIDIVQAIFPLVQGIYIYGSMARGEGRSDSDVDIAVVQESAIEADQALQLRSQLGVRLGRDIDVLDLRRASTEIAFQVVGEGLCILGADHESVALYENSIMSMYAALQIERKEIIEDIVKRGMVYGK